jgi:hypothetical protein
MDELKMTGNCLKGSRGLLSFDAAFDSTEWGKLVKELFTHVGKSQSFLSLVVLIYRADFWCAFHGTKGQAVH